MVKIQEINIDAVENQWNDDFYISKCKSEIYYLNRYKLDQIQIFPEQAEIIIKRLELIPVCKNSNLMQYYKLDQIKNLITNLNDEIAYRKIRYTKDDLIPKRENELNSLKKAII